MKIFPSISAIMADIGPIAKERQGSLQYKFRGIDDIYNALQPLLAKHKVFCTPKVIDQKREERQTKSGGTLTYSILTIQYTLYAEDGSSVDSILVGEAMDSSDKSSNKAMSAAQKYFFLQVFNIPTEEEKDTESQHHEPTFKVKQVKASLGLAKDQLLYLNDLMQQLGWSQDQKKSWIKQKGFESSTDIPQSDFEGLKEDLMQIYLTNERT